MLRYNATHCDGMLLPMFNPHEHDDRLRDLRDRFPGWRIWYVPCYGKGLTWCAQPLPHLEADSAEHLAEYIADAHQDTDTNPALHQLPAAEPARTSTKEVNVVDSTCYEL